MCRWGLPPVPPAAAACCARLLLFLLRLLPAARGCWRCGLVACPALLPAAQLEGLAAAAAPRAASCVPCPPGASSPPPDLPLPCPCPLRLQLSLEEYLAQGVVTEYEIEMCSPTQLEFLIRKRTEVATAAASSPPASPKRGRSRGPVRVPPVAAVQAAAASAAPTVEEEEEAPPQKLVVPRAPPLTVGAARRGTAMHCRPVQVARATSGAASAQRLCGWPLACPRLGAG